MSFIELTKIYQINLFIKNFIFLQIKMVIKERLTEKVKTGYVFKEISIPEIQ